MTMGNSANVLYCKTKKRQWSGLCQLYPLIQYVHARPADVAHCPREVSKQPNAKNIKKSCKMRREFVPKKKKMSTRRGSIKESLCSSLWWHCKKQTARSERVWSSDVHTFTTRQSFHQSRHNAPHSLTGSSLRLLTCLRNVIHENKLSFFLDKEQRWTNASPVFISCLLFSPGKKNKTQLNW